MLILYGSVVEGCGQLFHMPKIKISLGHFGMESVPDPSKAELCTLEDTFCGIQLS